MRFEVTLGKSRKNLSVILPEGFTCSDVLFMIAEKYGDEWYGAGVSCKETNSFHINAVESYYTGIEKDGSINKYYDFPEEYKKRTVYEWAIHEYVRDMKINRGVCKIGHCWDDGDECTTYTPIDIFEEA